MKLENKICVVTGGANGIGQATVRQFLAEGAKVVIGDLNEELGNQVCNELGEYGDADSIKFMKLDVRNENEVEVLLNQTCEWFGGLDVIFNNAGVIGAVGPLWDLDEEDWDYTFDILVKGVFFGIKHASRAFRKQKRAGVILNTSSVSSNLNERVITASSLSNEKRSNYYFIIKRKTKLYIAIYRILLKK